MTKATMMVFDDDPDLGALIVRVALSLGIEARRVVDSRTFFAEFAAWQPSMLMLDLCMPLMNGAEVLAQIAETRQKAHIIVMSGLGEEAITRQKATSRAAGLDIAGVLAKPFTVAGLRDLLKESMTRLAG